MVVYGNTKTGKTRFAATFPKPLLLIGTEDGTKSIEGISGVDFARIYSSEEYDTLIDHARTTAKYRTVVLDTGGGLQDIILKEVLGLDEIPMSKRWGINIEGSSWGAVVIQTNERLLNALKLSETLGINTIFIAHERSNAESESSTDLGPSVGPALTPKSAGFLNAQCDYVVQTFKKKKYEIERVEILGEVQEISKPLDEVDYCLRVGPSPVYTTGFRVGIWTKTLPPLIYDPSYEKVLEVINGTYKEGEVKDNKGSKDMTSS